MTRLARAVGDAGPILLDFDGPVCSVFANHPTADVVARLRAVLAREGVPPPAALASSRDPLELLRWAGSQVPTVVAALDEELVAAELRAVTSATPTPSGHAFVTLACQVGRPVRIVSNNSHEAITRYLTLHRLGGAVAAVHGRPVGHPELMKPAPHLLRAALAGGDDLTNDAVLIGDSPTDIQAARAAGIRAVAFVSKAGKRAVLAAAEPDHLISHMRELIE